jgi:hypothetical protein
MAPVRRPLTKSRAHKTIPSTPMTPRTSVFILQAWHIMAFGIHPPWPSRGRVPRRRRRRGRRPAASTVAVLGSAPETRHSQPGAEGPLVGWVAMTGHDPWGMALTTVTLAAAGQREVEPPPLARSHPPGSDADVGGGVLIRSGPAYPAGHARWGVPALRLHPSQTMAVARPTSPAARPLRTNRGS